MFQEFQTKQRTDQINRRQVFRMILKKDMPLKEVEKKGKKQTTQKKPEAKQGFF